MIDTFVYTGKFHLRTEAIENGYERAVEYFGEGSDPVLYNVSVRYIPNVYSVVDPHYAFTLTFRDHFK